MYKQHSILAIVPARGGSKGLPGKNIMPLAGQPMINWTIQAGRDSSYIDRIIVSTDCQEIAGIAQNAGADAPFLRPSALASDDATMEEVVTHCLEWLVTNEAQHYEFLLLLQPTSPLRITNDIDDAIAYYFENRMSVETGLISVVDLDPRFGWLMSLNQQQQVDFCIKENCSRTRQDLPSYFLPNGALYLAPTAELVEHFFYLPEMLHYVMPENKSVDIDNIDDFNHAEKILKNNIIKLHMRSAG